MADEMVKTEEEIKTETPKSEAASVTPETDKKKAKKAKRQIQKGQAHILCTYNNTIVTVSDLNGGVLGWSSSGHLGFKGAKKSTPYAASQVVADLSEKVKKY